MLRTAIVTFTAVVILMTAAWFSRKQVGKVNALAAVALRTLGWLALAVGCATLFNTTLNMPPTLLNTAVGASAALLIVIGLCLGYATASPEIGKWLAQRHEDPPLNVDDFLFEMLAPGHTYHVGSFYTTVAEKARMDSNLVLDRADYQASIVRLAFNGRIIMTGVGNDAYIGRPKQPSAGNDR